MTKQYSCNLCKKKFKQKIDYTRHKNKKSPCITLTEMQQISQTKKVKMDNKTTLISVFKNQPCPIYNTIHKTLPLIYWAY